MWQFLPSNPSPPRRHRLRLSLPFRMSATLILAAGFTFLAQRTKLGPAREEGLHFKLDLQFTSEGHHISVEKSEGARGKIRAYLGGATCLDHANTRDFEERSSPFSTTSTPRTFPETAFPLYRVIQGTCAETRE